MFDFIRKIDAIDRRLSVLEGKEIARSMMEGVKREQEKMSSRDEQLQAQMFTLPKTGKFYGTIVEIGKTYRSKRNGLPIVRIVVEIPNEPQRLATFITGDYGAILAAWLILNRIKEDKTTIPVKVRHQEYMEEVRASVSILWEEMLADEGFEVPDFD